MGDVCVYIGDYYIYNILYLLVQACQEGDWMDLLNMNMNERR